MERSEGSDALWLWNDAYTGERLGCKEKGKKKKVESRKIRGKEGDGDGEGKKEGEKERNRSVLGRKGRERREAIRCYRIWNTPEMTRM